MAENEAPLRKEILTNENVGESDAARSFGGVQARLPQEIQPGFIAGIVAPPNTGKTTLLGTLLDSERTSPAVIIDSAANAQVLPDSDRLFVVKSRTGFDTARAVVNELKSGKHGDIRAIAFDHVTNMYNQEVALKEGDRRQAYQKAMTELLSLTRDCVDLAEGPRKLNVFFIFQEAQENRVIFENGEIKGIVRQEISLSDKMQTSWPNLVPLLACLRIGMYVDPFPRVLDFTPSENTMTKWQIKQSDTRLARLPILVWNPSLGRIVDVIVGGEPVPDEWRVQPKAQLKKA